MTKLKLIFSVTFLLVFIISCGKQQENKSQNLDSKLASEKIKKKGVSETQNPSFEPNEAEVVYKYDVEKRKMEVDKGNLPHVTKNLCQEDENVIFSGPIEGEEDKFLSICSSKDLSKSKGYIQYRYGTKDISYKEKIELSYPKKDKLSSSHKSFKVIQELYSGGMIHRVVFKIGNYRYIVFDGKTSSPDPKTGKRVGGRNSGVQIVDVKSGKIIADKEIKYYVEGDLRQLSKILPDSITSEGPYEFE